MLAQSQSQLGESSVSLLSESQLSERGSSLRDRAHVAGRVHVEVLGARNLHAMVLGSLLKWSQNYSNPYVKVTLHRQEFVTTTKKMTVDPAWKEDEYMDVPLPTEQQLLQSIGVASERRHSQSIAKKLVQSTSQDANDKIAFHPCFPDLHVQVYHQNAEVDEDDHMQDGQQDDDKLIGTAVVSLLPCLLSNSSTHRAWYPLVDADGNEKAGQIQLAMQYEAGGMEPKKGDLVRLVGFGGMEYYAKLFTINAELEVADMYQDQVLVNCKSIEGWPLSFEMHRNLLFVTHRPSIIRDTKHQLKGQFSRVKHSRVLTAAAEFWGHVPRRPREQLTKVYKLTFLTATTAYGVVTITAKTTVKQGLRAGVQTYVEGATNGVQKVTHAIVVAYFPSRVRDPSKPTLEDDLQLYLEGGPTRGRGHISRAFALSKDKDDSWGAEDEIFSDEEEEEETELVSEPDGDEDTVRTNDKAKASQLKEDGVPDQLICPITGCLMEDPVVAADGHSYERKAIERWLKAKNVSPMTGLPMPTTQVFPNLTLRNLAAEYRQGHAAEV